MGVVSSVAAVAEQHVVCVSFASADAAASVEDGAGPQDAPLQTGQVNKHLGVDKTLLKAFRKDVRSRWRCEVLTWDKLLQACKESLQRSNTVFTARPLSLPPSDRHTVRQQKNTSPSFTCRSKRSYHHWPGPPPSSCSFSSCGLSWRLLLLQGEGPLASKQHKPPHADKWSQDAPRGGLRKRRSMPCSMSARAWDRIRTELLTT